MIYSRHPIIHGRYVGQKLSRKQVQEYHEMRIYWFLFYKARDGESVDKDYFSRAESFIGKKRLREICYAIKCELEGKIKIRKETLPKQKCIGRYMNDTSKPDVYTHIRNTYALFGGLCKAGFNR